VSASALRSDNYSMKTISKEVLTFGKVWATINATSYNGLCRGHPGEFSIWAAFLLVVGAIVRWFPGQRRHISAVE
jgi:hypothetical protein